MPEPKTTVTAGGRTQQQIQIALRKAKGALNGDSNDAEHDALLELVQAVSAEQRAINRMIINKLVGSVLDAWKAK